MEYLPVLFCLLSIAFAVRDTQLNLEDIEKDNLASERRVQQVPRLVKEDAQLPQQYVTPPQPATPPQLQYGFKPMKNPPQYTPQPQRAQIQQQQQQQHYNLAAQQQYTTLPQYFTYQPVLQQQAQQEYIAPSRAQQYVQANPQYQLPYVTDNHIAQDTNTYQQYYTNPQYLFYQQYPAASNNIQTVVDPKGGIQYVMYVPAHYLQQGAKAEQTQTVETLLQPQQDLFATPGYTLAQLSGGEQQYQYVLPQTHAQGAVPTVQPQVQIQAQIPKFQDIQYVQQQAPQIQQKSPKFEFASQKYEPKSLLDSYVPSVLQVQYYKQQQQQAQGNAIRHSLKAATQPISGKGDFAKNYVPQAAASAAQSYSFQYAYPTQGVQVKQH